MAPRGRSMIGVGRTVRADRLVEYELVVLREQDGQLAYQAHPSGQPSAVFLSKTVGDAEVLFENPTHDFPQRVGYRRDGPDGLLAWIEGTRNGQVARASNFRTAAWPCPGREAAADSSRSMVRWRPASPNRGIRGVRLQPDQRYPWRPALAGPSLNVPSTADGTPR